MQIWTEPDNDEPEDNWIAMDEPSYKVALYLALNNIGSEDED